MTSPAEAFHLHYDEPPLSGSERLALDRLLDANDQHHLRGTQEDPELLEAAVVTAVDIADNGITHAAVVRALRSLREMLNRNGFGD